MKIYEEWYKLNSYDRMETKKAWRAALRWALDLKKENIYTEIKNELNEN